MSARAWFRLAGTAALLALAACTEKPQTPANDGRNSGVDAKAWSQSDAAKPTFIAPDWTPGDQASWDKQIQQRTQTQNEYKR